MWLLECDDKEALGGKRMWLRPGARCVLGRVKQGDVTATVPSSRSISRRHLVINIGEVNEEDGVKIHTRSQITMQDCNTKHGTKVDGQVITGSEITLEGDEHSFHLGKHEHAFRLKWTPVIFSFSLTSKERRDKNVMAPYRAKVERLGIKTIATWTDSTTHVVASKRNTAIGLQALVGSRHIVTSAYLDAIAAAAELPPAFNGETPMSTLEIDFDAHWPDPHNFLPSSGNEPVTRPSESYRPDLRRKNLFEGWTFVFCEDVQYQNLLGPITDAGGKPEKFLLQLGVTRAEDLAEFVQKRGAGSDVALVRFRSKTDPDWERRFADAVQELLGFRMVEQNEFLEIILSCDTAALRRPLYTDSTVRPTRPPRPPPRPTEPELPAPTPAQDIQPTPSDQPPTHAPARARTRIRRKLATQIDSFTFDLGGDFLPAPTPEPSTQSIESKRSLPAWSHDGPISTSSLNQLPPTRIDFDDDTPSSIPDSLLIGVQPPSARKRPAPTSTVPDPDENLDVMDLLPGSRIVKRRKIAEEGERTLRATPAPPPTPPPPNIEKAEKPAAPKSKKQVGKLVTPFEAQARGIREKQQAEAERVKAEEKSAMEGLDIDGMKNLAIVEVIKVKPRENHQDSDRWRPEWNGRNNFKKFRRAGGGNGGVGTRSISGPRVMVELVEHRGRGYGIGDEYWVDHEENTATKGLGMRKNTPAVREVPEVVDLTQTRGRQIQTQGLAPAGRKRPAPAQTGRAVGGKKLKTVEDDDESSSEESDDDEFKFRRRR